MSTNSELLILNFVTALQKYVRLRRLLAGAVLLALFAAMLFCLYDLLPRTYVLRIAGGEVVSNRHHLARSLQLEAAGHGLALNIAPFDGAQQTAAQLDQGELDLAFVQAGTAGYRPNLVHVATISPELLHVLVKPGIASLAELRGRLVNLGTEWSETRVSARQVLAFSGLRSGVDYVESNLSQEELMGLRPAQLPDVVADASFVPSLLADFLVRQRGYGLLEVGFPAALAKRYGWADSSAIDAYMYSVTPAVPPRALSTVGISLQLLAHKDVDGRAIARLLEVLFSPSMEVRMKMKFDEARLTYASAYPLSEGSKEFLARNHPILSHDNLKKAQAVLGLVFSALSAVLLMLRWFKGQNVNVATHESLH